MIVLAARTDKPEAELYLYKANILIEEVKWQAHRELSLTLHSKIEEILENNDFSYKDLCGLVVYKGPGSFTGLRIGITVFNTIANTVHIPIVGEPSKSWLQDGLRSLDEKNDHKLVLPHYGADANITKPKK